jgi:hypothetical protein
MCWYFLLVNQRIAPFFKRKKKNNMISDFNLISINDGMRYTYDQKFVLVNVD